MDENFESKLNDSNIKDIIIWNKENPKLIELIFKIINEFS